MKAQIKLSHPSAELRGKVGLVYDIKFKTKYLYNYRYSRPDANDDNQSKYIYNPEESFIYEEPQRHLIERGMFEHVKEIPTDEIDYVELNVDTINTTQSNGITTLIGVSPMSYQRVLVDGKYVVFLNDRGFTWT